MQHLTSLFDINRTKIEEIFSVCKVLKSELQQGTRTPHLQSHVLAQLFDKPSLRTRVSFEAAMMQLGGNSTFFSSKDAGLQGRESLPDVARVLGGFVDVIVIRTFSQELIEEFAAHCPKPTINGLSDDFHPCQALTDLFTIDEAFGGLDKQHIVYMGDGNNVAASLAIAAGYFEMPITICSPADYSLSTDFLDRLKATIPNVDITLVHEPSEAVKNADVIYTDVWASMGQETESKARQKAFADYQVNSALLDSAPSGCKFMHCLPAKRGLEVTDNVMESPQSIVFQQAENRMHLAKGLLKWIIEQS